MRGHRRISTATVRFVPCYTAAISLKRGRPSSLRSSGCRGRRSLLCACAPSHYTPHQGCTCHRALRTPAWQSLQAVAPPPYAHQSSGVMMEPLYASRDTKSTSPAALPSARCAVSTPLSTCPQALCLFTLAPPPDARGLTHAPYTLVRVRWLHAGCARESEPAGAAGGRRAPGAICSPYAMLGATC